MNVSRLVIVVFSCSVLFLGCDTRPAPSELKPIPVDDISKYSVAAGGTLTVETLEKGILENDVDPNKYNYKDEDPEAKSLSVVDPTSVELTDSGEGTLLKLNKDGTFKYAAPKDFSGIATFEYMIEDTGGGGRSKDAAVVKISVK